MSLASTSGVRRPLGTVNGSSGSRLAQAKKPATSSAAPISTQRATSGTSTAVTSKAKTASQIVRPRTIARTTTTTKRPTASASSTRAAGAGAKRGPAASKATSGPSAKRAAPGGRTPLSDKIAELEETVSSKTLMLQGERERHQSEIKELTQLHKLATDELTGLQHEVAGVTARLEDMSAAKTALAATLQNTAALLDEARATIAARDAQVATLEQQVAAHEKTIEECQQQAHEDEQLRRKLHNTIQELKGNIRVFCRIRPLLGKEVETGKACMEQPEEDPNMQQLTVTTTKESATHVGKAKPKSHHFAFDRVFGPASSQAGVFEEISQLVQSALDGYNICIFAYGQTGSGKTFTMEGGAEAEERGMIPRAVQQIFATAAELETKGWTYTFAASFLEIYQESIRDLLADPSASEQKLEVKKVKGSADVEVPGLTVQAVTSEEEINAVLERAAAVRATARTEMNERSSRSHSVFQLRITGTNAASGDTCAATLNLIDLAGSERVASSKAEGERLQEAKAINKSLSSLGNVIMALGNGDAHVPYRDSKLTYLLQNHLGGNNKSLMFINVSPLEASAQESINSLRFATKVNQCQIGTARRVSKTQ